MGRYYRTASANPMDFMHKLNIPLMERALQFNDQAITDEYAQGQAITDSASSFNRITDDDDRANKIAQGYTNQIGELTKTIASDPANWRKHSEPLRQLKQDLLTNYKTGEISKIAGNYNSYKTWKTAVDKQVEKGKLDPQTAKAYEQYYLNNWRKNGAGTNFNNGRYNILQMDGVMDNRNIKEELTKGFDKVKSDLNATESNEQPGMYLIHKGSSKETVSRARLYQLAIANLSPELQTYMKSRQGVGLLSNIYDNDGALINPINGFGLDPEAVSRASKLIADTKIADPKKAAQMQAELEAYAASQSDNIRYNPNSGLSSMLRGGIESSAWTKQKNTETIKADPVELPVWMQGRREIQSNANRDAANWRFSQGQEGQDRRQAQGFENAKELLNLKNDYKTAPTAKKATALKEEYAKAYIGEIVGPERNFATDAGLAGRGDESARVRLREALADAAPAAIAAFRNNQSNRNIAVEYTNYLSGKPSTEATIQDFMKMKSKTGRREDFVYSEGGLDQWGKRNIIALPVLEEVGRIYNAKVNKWYENTKGSSQQISTNPLTPQAQTAISESINLSPGSYFGINEQGQRTELPGAIETIIGAVGATGQSKLGYRVKLKDKSDNKGGSDIIWVFPKTENLPTYKLNRANILEGLADKNSVYATALKEEEINDINYLLSPNVGVQTEDGTRNIIQIGRESVAGTLHLNGTVTIKDADGNNEQPFSSVADLVQQYHAAQEAVTKKK